MRSPPTSIICPSTGVSSIFTEPSGCFLKILYKKRPSCSAYTLPIAISMYIFGLTSIVTFPCNTLMIVPARVAFSVWISMGFPSSSSGRWIVIRFRSFNLAAGVRSGVFSVGETLLIILLQRYADFLTDVGHFLRCIRARFFTSLFEHASHIIV